MTAGKATGSVQRLPQEQADVAPLRFVSAASLFDGHDAAINIIRRLLQAHGAEVVHLGHNRSVADIVRAAIQEDADGIAVSSYQGGHNEYFRYMVDMLRELGAGHIRIVVGGGGTIAPHEIEELHAYGVERIYSPEDGRKLGLDGMIRDVIERVSAWSRPAFKFGPVGPRDHQQIARTISALEIEDDAAGLRETLRKAVARVGHRTAVVGITGTGGAGKSSLTDELLMRFVRHFPERNIAVVAMDPTRRRSGGALLGDRIRMNSLAAEQVFMRSLATRRQNLATSAVLADVLNLLRYANFDLIVVETAGIGQSDSEIVDLVDVPLYVMTSEYGAASQLEKIDMLDFAELIALNKFEKRGAEDALRDVRKQWRRNHVAFQLPDADVPVFPTIASRFNDPGVNRLFAALGRRLDEKLGEGSRGWAVADPGPTELVERHALVPAGRTRYLAEIAANGRRAAIDLQHRSEAASRANSLHEALRALDDPQLPAALDRFPDAALADASDAARSRLREAYNDALDAVGPEALDLLRQWPALAKSATDDEYCYVVRGREIRGDNYTKSLSHTSVPKLAIPKYRDWGDLLAFLLKENLPGHFPYVAGVYPYRREEEDPTRMFAGEGAPERTNRRFHYVAAGHGAARLSTAFDSTTLYGEDPDERPDIYGRIGNSGVSIATLDDMKKLYSGFDLCAPTTSVSMTINGPAPMILAMYMNTAVDQRVERHLRETGGWAAAQRKIGEIYRDRPRPTYKGELPPGHDGSGLGLLGVTGDQLVDRETYERIRAEALAQVRGTVQADILKEDQAQNTCIFSTEFALRMMGDVQQYFSDQRRPQFLLGVDLRLSHRRGRCEPDLAARLHARERADDRRVLPRARHEDRRLRAEPVVLLLERHGSGVRGDRPGGATHLGTCDARPLRRRATLADAEVPHPDVGPQPARPRDPVQRRAHDAAGAVCAVRQLQQPAHQRVRRGDHDAHRGIGATGGRDTADHQQGTRAQQDSEPVAGFLRGRGADRHRRGSRVPRVRQHLRAGRRARRHGDDVPAQPHPGGEPLLRDDEA